MQVLIDDLVIRYERTGNGPQLLLVHGWADSLSSFYEIQKTLSKNYDVTAIDLPGFGQSSQPREAWNLNNYANCLNKFTSKIKIKPYGLIGHSNGGAILINALANKDLTAQKLVLLGSAGIRDKNKAKKQTLKVVAKSGKALTSVLPSGIKNNIRQRFYGRIGSDLLIAPGMEETFKLVVDQDIRHEATKLNIPTLLIYGKNDTSTPVDYGQILESKIKGSTLKVLDNAEHFVHNDQPHQVEKLIKDFLE